MADNGSLLSRTWRYARRILVGVALVCSLLAIYGLIEPRFLDVQRIQVSVPNLPPEWDGATVALISDFQLGIVFDNASTTAEAIDEIREAEPDLILLGGDYVYSADPDPERQVRQAVDLVRPLAEADLPTYAVLGNHDVEQDVGDLLVQELEAAGIPVLSNEAVNLESDGDSGMPLYLVGIAPHRPGLDDVDAALAELPEGAPRLVLMHNPDSFPRIPSGQAPIAFAGHTHGGQLRIPFLPDWSFLALIEEEEVTVDGFIPDFGEPDNVLYVNRGIGMSKVPLRINAAPELTIARLRAGPPQSH